MTEIESGIYSITNKINDKRYIGSAKNLNRRWCEHKNMLKNNKHHSKHLENAWYKYGEGNFLWEILEYIEDLTMLLKREQFWIEYYNVCDFEFGYNISPIAGSQLGFKHSEKTKNLLRIISSSKSHTEETKKKLSLIRIGQLNPFYNKKHSQKMLEKLSLIGRGENNNNSKLSLLQVNEIRNKYATGEYTQQQLSDEYCVHRTAIQKIISFKTWKNNE